MWRLGYRCRVHLPRGVLRTPITRVHQTVRHFSLPPHQPTTPTPDRPKRVGKIGYTIGDEPVTLHESIKCSPPTHSTHPSPKLADALADTGLSRFVRKTYLKVGLGSAASLVMMQVAPMVPAVMEHPLAFCLGGLAISLGGIWGMHTNKGKIIMDKSGNAVDMDDPPEREASFWAIVGGMGLSVAPFASMMHDISPAILPAATVITLGVMGGASLYAYNTPPQALSPWKGPLYGSLIGIVGICVTGLLSG